MDADADTPGAGVTADEPSGTAGGKARPCADGGIAAQGGSHEPTPFESAVENAIEIITTNVAGEKPALETLEITSQSGKAGTVALEKLDDGEDVDYLLRYKDESDLQITATAKDPSHTISYIRLYENAPYYACQRVNLKLDRQTNILPSSIGQVMYVVVGPERPTLDSTDLGTKNKTVQGMDYESLLQNIKFHEDVNTVYTIRPETMVDSAYFTRISVKKFSSDDPLPMTPAFDPGVYAYEVELPYDQAAFHLSAVVNESYSSHARYIVKDESGKQIGTYDHYGAQFTIDDDDDPGHVWWNEQGKIVLTLTPVFEQDSGNIEGQPCTLTLVRSLKPVLVQKPGSVDIDSSMAPRAISLQAMVAKGELSYQWYQSETAMNEGGTKIEGATSPSYTPEAVTLPEKTVFSNVRYFYCEITNTVDGKAYSITTDAVRYEVRPNIRMRVVRADGASLERNNNIESGLEIPKLTIDLSEEEFAETDGQGTWAYQWLVDLKPVANASDKTFSCTLEGDASYMVECQATFKD